MIRFTELGVETFVNPFSITICFPAPTLRIICKYALVTHCDKHLGNISCIIVLPHVTRDVLDSFFKDLSQQNNRINRNPTRKPLSITIKLFSYHVLLYLGVRLCLFDEILTYSNKFTVFNLNYYISIQWLWVNLRILDSGI